MSEQEPNTDSTKPSEDATYFDSNSPNDTQAATNKPAVKRQRKPRSSKPPVQAGTIESATRRWQFNYWWLLVLFVPAIAFGIYRFSSTAGSMGVKSFTALGTIFIGFSFAILLATTLGFAAIWAEGSKSGGWSIIWRWPLVLLGGILYIALLFFSDSSNSTTTSNMPAGGCWVILGFFGPLVLGFIFLSIAHLRPYKYQYRRMGEWRSSCCLIHMHIATSVADKFRVMGAQAPAGATRCCSSKQLDQRIACD